MTDQPVEPQPAGLGLGPWDGPEPEEPTDAELFGLWPDPFAGPPDDDAVLAALTRPELDHGSPAARRWMCWPRMRCWPDSPPRPTTGGWVGCPTTS